MAFATGPCGARAVCGPGGLPASAEMIGIGGEDHLIARELQYRSSSSDLAGFDCRLTVYRVSFANGFALRTRSSLRRHANERDRHKDRRIRKDMTVRSPHRETT